MIISQPDEEMVREALRHVMDPELDCNIVDLGLIHRIIIHKAKVTIEMTLTTPGCPMHESIARGAQAAIHRLDGVDDVEVNLVWDPPWSPARMTEQGRTRMGIYES